MRLWKPLRPDHDSPEAEWGFEPALRDDIERFARERGYRVRRVVFVRRLPERFSLPEPLPFYRIAEALGKFFYRRVSS